MIHRLVKALIVLVLMLMAHAYGSYTIDVRAFWVGYERGYRDGVEDGDAFGKEQRP